MNITPQNFQIVQCHEPAAADAVLDTSTPINLENADGVLIIVQHSGTSDADPVLTVHEGSTAAECTSGTYPLAVESGSTSGSEFQIWVNTATGTSDTLVKQTDGVTYTINGDGGGNYLVVFNVRASNLTNGRKWVNLGASAGHASNIMSAIYILYGGRYQQTTPPTAIA